MRVNRLFLTNFRSHRQTEMSFKRVNIIGGPNGSGKTSIQMAIETLLTGKCDVTDAAGRGAQSLISAGASSFKVHALTDKGEMEFQRNGSGGQLIIGSFAGKAAYGWLEANVAPIPVLSAVLNAHRFLEMDEKEQKALLANALAADPVAIDPEILKLHEGITVGFPLQTSVTSADQVDRVYKWHYDLRANVNREIKAFGEIVAPAKPQDLPMRDAVAEKIGDLRKERDAKVVEKSKKLSEYQSRKALLDSAKQQKAQHEPNLLSSPELADCEKQVKNRTKVAKLDKEIADLQFLVRENRSSLAKLNEPQSDKCPACGQSVAKSDRSEAIGSYESKIAEYEKNLVTKQAERNRIPDPELAKQKLDAHQFSQSPYLRAEQTIKEIGELGDAPDVTAEEEAIKTLDERITKGEAVLQTCTEYEAKEAQYKQVAEKAKTLKAQSAALDRLCEYFSDKGPLKGKLVGGRLPAFRQRVNDVLRRFGFLCNFELDPYKITLARDVDEASLGGLNLIQLSESEQYRFGIAFQIALAEATGVGVVIIDRADMLNPSARKQLTQALLESNLSQAFVLATREPSAVPQIEDVAFFELLNENGVTSVLAQEMADAVS